MHFTKAFTFAAIVLAGSTFAVPNPTKPAKPVKPVGPTIDQNQQSIDCGNGGTTYCCNGGDGSTANLGTCQEQAFGSTCNAGTVICCQANNSIQNCLAGATEVRGL
ncbi:hypothetical protein MMC31_007689 [Peltigera leucophlebia]|nr:hypothetical protein [Peltigera leucophlebia]